MRLPRILQAPTVGLDIGSSAVKGVILRQRRRGWTLTGMADLPLSVPAHTEPGGEDFKDSDSVVEGVRDVCKALKVRRVRVVAALSGHAVSVKRLTVPSMSDAELAEAIPWEAEQYVPFDLSEVHLDYQVLGVGSSDPKPKSDVLTVLLVAAKRDHIAARADVIARAGKSTSVIDIEAFALTNAYQVNYPERADPLAALIHVGRQTTVVCVLDRGNPAFTRDIAFGGQHHTDALVKDLGVDALAAERIKQGHLPDGIDAERASAVLREVTSQLVLEIRKSIDFFRSTAPIERLSRIVLSGGAWRADGLADLLGSEFDTSVEVMDPFRRIQLGRRAETGDVPGPEYAVAVGLALRQEVA